MLIELAGIPGTALPMAALRDQLRLGTGFSDDGLQDSRLEASLRAAIAAIEARIGKILIERGFVWTISRWRDTGGQALPVAPVSAVTGVTMLDRNGVPGVIDPARYALQRDGQRPRLMSTGSCLPAIPVGGSAEIGMVAGFGPGWADVPVDLAQAVLLLAAQYHDNRAGTAEAGTAPMPFGVMALIERWRTVRILGGGGA